MTGLSGEEEKTARYDGFLRRQEYARQYYWKNGT